MIRPLLLVAALAAIVPAGDLLARETVDASAPNELAVTVYRDPQRGQDQRMDRRWPRGFAMISEVRTVTLPPGESRIRFTGVAEGMVAVSAIVTGLPGGTIEKNRNADLLSPAALVDRSLGNRVTITRTDPASGVASSESAIVRTRADGGLVLQTQDGFEAVRCSGLPEKLTFDEVPSGLSSQPVYSIDTRSDAGGTYAVTLSYLAWGFDWEANYVARLQEARAGGGLRMELLSWLTILNDNGQSFPDADLMAVAGTLNVESDFEELADEPEARPLRLTCYPLGSTATGSPLAYPPPPPPPPPPPAAVMAMDSEAIVVTGSRIQKVMAEAAAPLSVIAAEEALGDLKLYRIPEPVTVAAQGQKQVAFLDKDEVDARFVYVVTCDYGEIDDADEVEYFDPARLLLVTKNDKARGLGQSLPMGGIAIYEPTAFGDLLVAETRLRDFALSEDIELDLPQSTQVFAQCGEVDREDTEKERRWVRKRAQVSNANDTPVTVRLDLGTAGYTKIRGLKNTRIKDGRLIYETEIPANSRRIVRFRERND
ncbi:hypothetical protein K3179_11000 [Qipengyuania sp. GH38]|uniref:DUF4139 domain-containing protein n=1 Tax=Qipengyuania intermedia TaxID=2867244 RepID=UPI001C879995|nr:hypothetical protein [Qipengyuania intermedia]MBX7515070.1 hypothetical protein [Qipengyuania intermedia]